MAKFLVDNYVISLRIDNTFVVCQINYFFVFFRCCMITINSLVLNVITSLLATLSTTFSSFSSIFLTIFFFPSSIMQFYIVDMGKKVALNFKS